MNAKQRTAGVVRILLVAGAALLAIAFTTNAQVKTQTNTQHGPAVHQVTVERGEVVYVSGNDLIVKMEDGQIRHFANVPDSVTINVDGKQLSVHDLKVGMKLQRTTVKTTTPRTITTVKTVTGTVWHVSPPNSLILTMEDGTNQSFKIPSGQKFTVDGQEKDAFGLKKGMKISAAKITEVPETVVTQQVARTGKMPPPPEPIPAATPILIYIERPASVETAAAPPAEPAPTKLPKTASYLPLLALLGALLTALGLSLKAARTLAS